MPLPVLFVYSDRLCSCTRVRTFEVIKALHQHERAHIHPEAIYFENLKEEHFNNYPIILFQRLGANGGIVSSQMKNWLANVMHKYRNQCKFIYDLDDLLLDRQKGFPEKMLSECHIALAPNEVLSRAFGRYQARTEVIRTHIDEKFVLQLTQEPRAIKKNNPIQIAWITISLMGVSIMNSIANELEKRIGTSAEIHLYGNLSLMPDLKKLLPSSIFHLHESVPLIQMHSIINNSDIVINPLSLKRARAEIMGIDQAEIELFINSKTELKFLHAGIFSKPLITTPIDAYRYVIEDGKTGFLPTSDEEWVKAIEKLVLDQPLRESMGKAAKEVVMEKYTLKRVATDYKNLFLKLARI